MSNISKAPKRKKYSKKKRSFKFWRLCLFILILAVICFGLFRLCQFSYFEAVHFYQEGQDIYTAYQNKKSAAPKEPAKFTRADTFLFIELDKENSNNPLNSLILFNIDQNNGAVSAILIPNNTAVPTDKGPVPISSLQQQYGSEKTIAAVGSLFSLSLDKYIVVDNNMLPILTDIIGGVDLYVAKDINYDDSVNNISIHLNRGYQYLNGNTAKQYLLYHSDDLGDFGRTKRQAIFFKAFWKQFFTMKTALTLPIFLPKSSISLTSDMDFLSFTNFINYGKVIFTNSFTINTLPGQFSANGLLWQPDATAINELISNMAN